MTALQLLYGNFYFFVLLFTVAYSLTFIYYLASHFQYSPTARTFTYFLGGVILWSVKDAVAEVLLPSFAGDTRGFLRTLAIISPMYLCMPLFAMNMILSVYNAAVSSRRRFRHLREANLAMGVLLLGVYIAALFDPHVLYRTLEIQGNTYHYVAGPGLIIFTVLIALGALLPTLMLMAATWGKWRTEAFYIVVGSTLTLAVSVGTNTLPSLLGETALPRLGCLSTSVLCALAFVGIVRHGELFSVSHLLEEREKFGLIAAGLEGIIDAYDENAIYQNICDHARSISESSLVSVVFFLEGNRTYEVRRASVRDLPMEALSASSAPFAPGSIHDVSVVPGLGAQLTSTEFLQMKPEEYLGGDVQSATEPLGRIREVLSFPIIHEKVVRGALVFLRDNTRAGSGVFRLFGVQCSLVLKFSWQIAELEKMRRLEEQLHRAQKMEAVGQLAGGIAHDFNNTLSGITGYAQLVRRRFAADAPELKEYADAIINAARHSADLTEKLLAFARKGRVEAIPVDINQVVTESLQILEPTLDKRIQIATHLGARPSMVMGDPSQLQNILVNLAINARNAMDNGGELTISTEVVTHDKAHPVDGDYEIRPGAYVVVTVQDTGVGMDPAVARRVFEPFFTTDQTGKGSGLGLSSVYGMVKSHNGFITVDSEVGAGTTFRVYLPMMKRIESTSAVRKRKTEQIIKGHGHVLVIDDDELICSLSREMLTFMGYTVTAVEGGQEAIEYYRAHGDDVDVAIIDIMMPRMDGYETFHELRQLNPDIKVILTTGYSLPRDTRYMASLGLCGFLQKPFESGRLSQMLYDVIHGKIPYRKK